MNIGKTLSDKAQQFMLKKKDEKKAAPFTFFDSVEDFAFDIKFNDFDKYSFVITEFAIKALDPGSWNIEQLKTGAEKLAKRLTYFLEDLAVLEVDPTKLQIQLRSEKADQTEATLTYFEMIVQGDGSIALARYQYDREKKSRTLTPFVLTSEVLERCVDDFQEVLSNK